MVSLYFFVEFLVQKAYQNMYVLMPGESKQIEAQADPYGLKVGIIYDAAPEGQILMYQMWKVKNESVLTITYVNGGDISTFGGQLITAFFGCAFSLYKLSSVQFYLVLLGFNSVHSVVTASPQTKP